MKLLRRFNRTEFFLGGSAVKKMELIHNISEIESVSIIKKEEGGLAFEMLDMTPYYFYCTLCEKKTTSPKMLLFHQPVNQGKV
jgi:hypothetical protein